MNTTTLETRRARAALRWQQLVASPRPVIYVGAGSCGLAAGAGAVLDGLRSYLAQHDLAAEVVKVGCIGPCYLEPLVDFQMPGKPRLSYGNMTAELATKTFESLLSGQVPRSRLLGVLEDSVGEAAHDGLPRFFEQPMLKNQLRLVLRNCGIIDPDEIDHSLARGGYTAFEKCLQMSPEEVIEVVRRSGLRGRGGAGFPTGQKWQFCRQAPGDVRYLICNADEGDPGAFMNRALIEGDPHSLLEGMLIAAYAIGAQQGYIYIRAEYPLAVRRLRTAVGDMRELGLLGERILDTDFSFDLAIKEGAGAFVCGEETALIASIEGRRGMPRTRPPFPAQQGLWGKPTIINNVETLATVPTILGDGPETYARLGTETSKGTKTFSLVGKVRRTGLIEVPLGTTLRQIIYDIGGGPTKNLKAIQTGGPSGGCLSEEFLDTPIDYESLSRAGSIMGSGGLIVMDRDTCIVDTARFFLRFTQSESCGKCVPCRVGIGHLVTILDSICAGRAELADLDRLEQLARVIKAGSLCGLGQTAPNPVLAALKYFRQEFVEHIVQRRCRATVCKALVQYRVIPSKCTGCQRCVQVCPTGAITGPRAEPHNLDPSKCIKCRSCYEICRFDAIAGDAIIIESEGVRAD